MVPQNKIVGHEKISEISDEKPITTNGIEKIKRPKFSCKDCSFIGINKYDIIRHRRPGYRAIFEPSLLLGLDIGLIGVFLMIVSVSSKRQIHLGPPTKRHQCNQCEFSTIWKSNYNLHMPWVQIYVTVYTLIIKFYRGDHISVTFEPF